MPLAFINPGVIITTLVGLRVNENCDKNFITACCSLNINDFLQDHTSIRFMGGYYTVNLLFYGFW